MSVRTRSRTLPARRGRTLLETFIDNGVAIFHDCQGKGTCGTCRVRVTSGADSLNPMTDQERLHLDHPMGAGLRLACQCMPFGDVEVDLP